jgi:energy-coupling factor transporter ATP-binding protein EcfA2
MQESLEASLVRIRTADGRVVGAGFLVGEHHILTCAHVVSQALGLPDSPVDPLQGAVSLDFPLVPPCTRLTASVVQWCPPLSDGRGDIAGLELLGDPPAGAEVVRFAPAEDVWKHDFSALGFPKDLDDGVWATGRLLGRQATNWIQIEDVKAQGFAVVPGFSGTPVWDMQLQGVVGMVVAASRPTETKTAFVIPLEVLVAAWPLIEPITRQRIFLSAASTDADLAARLTNDLEERGIVVWTEQHTPGENHADKEERVRQAIRAAQAVVLVVSSQTRSSRTVKEHLRLADLYQRQLILVWVGDDEPAQPQHYGWRETIWIDAHNTQYMAALEAIAANLSQRRSISALLGPSRASPEQEPRNPYKGLRAFTADDAGDFFGRDRLVDELVKDVARMLAAKLPTSESGRLLTIIGPSGSGKSSVVMAGLLPDLQHGALPGSTSWVYLEPIVPGKHPIEALGLTLAAHFPDRSFTSIREDLEDDTTRGLHVLATQLAKQQGSKVVLLVDQFEELFTQTESEDERRRFIDLLLTATAEPRGMLIVFLTLRADFYHRLMQYSELYRLIEAHHRPALQMEVGDLRATIEQPAALPDVQLTFEGNLVGDLLFEMQGQAGALPLLQFTLEQLFERRSGHRLTLQAYREIGGVKGALSQHAEQTYAALPSEEHRKLAHALFVRLIDAGTSEQDTTRRRAALSEFTLEDPIQTRLLRETIDAFIAARLLTTNEVAGTTMVEVSHEAVIREWRRLVEWMREAREDIPLQKALSEDVAEWERRGKPRDRLYRGSQLKEAKVWAGRSMPSRKEATFLQASAVQRSLSLVGFIVAVLVLLSSTGIAGWYVFLQPKPVLVTTLQDNEVGSLRWCINNAPSGSMIRFDTSLWGHTIMLTGDLPIANKSLSLVGPGAHILTISNNTHQILVSFGASIRISGLTFKGSKFNSHSLLSNNGMLTLTDSTISNNTASGANGNGGGILNNNGGTLTITNSTISDNTTSNSYGGGGIYNNNGTLTITNSIVSGNSVSGQQIGGGGIANEHGTLTITNSTVSGNSVSGPKTVGGGILNDSSGTLTITNSTVSGNSVSGQNSGGGGILSDSSTLTITNSTVSDNTSQFGGGIYNYNGTLTLTNSIISGNTASGRGGGIINLDSTLTLTNSTISGNTASGANSNGGGIINQGGKADITFSTIYGNTAESSGGGIFIQDDHDINPPKPSHVVMRNSLVASNYAHVSPDIVGTLISDGNNLIQNFTGATFIDPLKMHHTDISGDKFPNLGIDPTLRDNGGSTNPHTLTHALLPGSPAIDAIPLQYCQVKGTFNSRSRMYTDQRGLKRPDENENKCDIGAYESSP